MASAPPRGGAVGARCISENRTAFHSLYGGHRGPERASAATGEVRWKQTQHYPWCVGSMRSVHAARQLDRSTFLSVTFLDHAPPTHPCLGHTFRRRDGCRGPGTLSAHKAVLKVTRFCLVRQTLLPCDQVTVLTPVLANCWSVLTPPLDCTNTFLSSGITHQCFNVNRWT